MITDTNNIVDFTSNMLIGATGGDIIFFAILFILAVGMALIYARAKSSTAVAVMASISIMFSFVAKELQFLFWLSLMIALFVLINGLRKWVTSQA